MSQFSLVKTFLNFFSRLLDFGFLSTYLLNQKNETHGEKLCQLDHYKTEF